MFLFRFARSVIILFHENEEARPLKVIFEKGQGRTNGRWDVPAVDGSRGKKQV